MSRMRNVVVAQSGGPTPVINSSLRGVIEACQAMPDEFGTIYGGFHGVEGVLKEELLNLSVQSPQEIALLSTTPAAGAIGSCRYKLRSRQAEDFNRALEVFRAHDVGYFFYIGGNDSMDTAHKVSELARTRGLDLVAAGVPKTIDNDLGDPDFKLIDHTPGYGSTARYWSLLIQAANEENAGSSRSDPVLVLQAMGRETGYVAAAARLADPERTMPLHIYMPESGLTLADLADNVNDELRRSGRCILVVGEGFPAGDLGLRRDAFGNFEYSNSKTSVAQAVVNYLNETGLAARGDARLNVPGSDQRHNMICASTVDLEEAYKVAQKAVSIAVSDGSGYMATIHREPGRSYHVRYDKVPLALVANSVRPFPPTWIAPNRRDVKDEFVRYARPLIGDSWPTVPLIDGRQRFAHLEPIFAPQQLVTYTPQELRA
jgi:ATP-dependent phosphofructokinase / diphosphate-dependent phosphofructokinase